MLKVGEEIVVPFFTVGPDNDLVAPDEAPTCALYTDGVSSAGTVANVTTGVYTATATIVAGRTAVITATSKVGGTYRTEPIFKDTVDTKLTSDKVDLVDAPNSTAVTAIQSGLALQANLLGLIGISAYQLNLPAYLTVPKEDFKAYLVMLILYDDLGVVANAQDNEVSLFVVNADNESKQSLFFKDATCLVPLDAAINPTSDWLALPNYFGVTGFYYAYIKADSAEALQQQLIFDFYYKRNDAERHINRTSTFISDTNVGMPLQEDDARLPVLPDIIATDSTYDSDLAAIAANQLILMGGAGAIAYDYPVTSSVGGAAIPGATVRATLDEAGSNLVGIATSDANGIAHFNLDAGPTYFWTKCAGYTQAGPDLETVA